MKNRINDKILGKLIFDIFYDEEEEENHVDFNWRKGWKDIIRKLEEDEKMPVIGCQAPRDNKVLIGAGRNKNKSKIARNPFPQNDV